MKKSAIDKTKRKAVRPAFLPSPGGELVTCPNGHKSARVEGGRDQQGVYVRAWCTFPGCGADIYHRPEPR